MYLSKHKNGFYYVYYFNEANIRKAVTTKTKLKNEALKFLSNFKQEIEKRKAERIKPVPLSEMVAQFETYSANHHTKKTQKTYSLTHSKLKTFLGNCNLNEITPKKLDAYFEQRLKASSLYQVRKDYIALNSLFSRAIAVGYVKTNPCKEIKPFRIVQKQPVFFTQLEFDLLISKIQNKDIKDLVIFALQTGLRQMEIVTLRWEQVNFLNRYLTLDNKEHVTKNKRVRTIPLTLKALQILTERQLTGKSEYVFTTKGKPFNPDTLSKQFKAFVRIANLSEAFHFHTLRHTFASWLVQNGVSIYEVKELLGHSTVSTTEIYAHLKKENLLLSINKLNLVN